MEAISKIAAEGLAEQSKPSQSLQRQVSQSRQDGLKTLLTKFGILRGEAIDAIRLESYSKAFAEEFKDDCDTLVVLGRLAKSRRGEYEAKIPDMGDLLESVRETRNARISAEFQAKRDAEDAAYRADVEAHPENYFTMAELHDEYQRRRTQVAEVESRRTR